MCGQEWAILPDDKSIVSKSVMLMNSFSLEAINVFIDTDFNENRK